MPSSTSRKSMKQKDPDDLFAALDTQVGKLKEVAKAAKRAKAAPAKKAVNGLPLAEDSYSAAHIEVLEGLEPVRRRPGMYIGGTDEKGLHHLFAEVIDNSMDEAVAGHATWIEVELEADGFVTVTDNGRGIPVDRHPEVQGQVRPRSHHDDAALGREVRLQGLRDLGRPARRRRLGGQRAVGIARGRGGARAKALPPALLARRAGREAQGARRGPQPARHPHPLQAGPGDLRQGRRLQARAPVRHDALEGLSLSAASRSAGCARPSWSRARTSRRRRASISRAAFPTISPPSSASEKTIVPIFAGRTEKASGHGAVEWAVAWFPGDGFLRSYCNTIPTARRRHA